jgi:hypothetical protein
MDSNRIKEFYPEDTPLWQPSLSILNSVTYQDYRQAHLLSRHQLRDTPNQTLE